MNKYKNAICIFKEVDFKMWLRNIELISENMILTVF